jgi:thiol-disulfide isomerase/thioredoxin
MSRRPNPLLAARHSSHDQGAERLSFRIIAGPLLLTLLASAPLAAGPTAAADFSDGAFADAQAKGQRILLDAYAPWCVTCRLQAPAIDKALQQSGSDEIIVFRLTEATRKSVWRRFRIQRYGTIVALAGYRETARAIGAIDFAAVAAVVDSSREQAMSASRQGEPTFNQKE